MTILLALTCENCAVVATDRRAIWPGGAFQDDYPKTFCFRGGRRLLVGGFSGLLEVRDLPVVSHIARLWASASTLDQLTEACARELASQLEGSEVGLDLVLAAAPDLGLRGHPIVHWVCLSVTGHRIESRSEIVGASFVTGDACARDAVNERLTARGWGPGPDKLRRDAESAIEVGVNRTGRHRSGPGACGGVPSVETLSLAPE